MRLFGYYETVPVQGSHRRVKVYVPGLLKHLLISLAIFLVPFFGVFSSARSFGELAEQLEEALRDPVGLIFFAILLLISLMTLWGNRLFARDAQRMVEGQLVARTGVLWAVGQQPNGKYPGPCRLAMEREDPDGRPIRDELYRMPEELHRRHKEKHAAGGAWRMELAVLPPASGPEFQEPASAPGDAPEGGPGERFRFDQMPVSRSEVAEIFYLEQQPYGCYFGGRELFPQR